MADWTELDTDGLLPGEPFTSAKALAFFENPVAITEGADDAPRIYGLAMSPDSKIIADGLALTVAASDAYTLDMGFTTVNGATTTTSTSYVEAAEITVVGEIVGVIRFKGSHRSSGAAITSTLRILKNSVVVTTFPPMNSSTPVQRSADISVVAGDIISWEHRQTGGNSSFFSDSILTASDRYARIGALIRETDL